MPNVDYTWQGRSLTNFYTYMGWQLITDRTSEQYRLRQDAGERYDAEGFGRIEDRYVIACTAPEDGGLFGTIGDRIDWVLADGTVLKTIVGDTKSPGDAEWIPLGHLDEVGSSYVCVVEFVVDRDTWYDTAHGGQASAMHANPGNPGCHPEWAGQIRSFERLGNYWGEPYQGQDGPPGVVGRTSPVSYISPSGADMLELHFAGGADPLLFYRANTVWLPRDAVSLPTSGPVEQPTGSWSRAADVLAWCRANRNLWRYNQSFADESGVYRGPGISGPGTGCDCSGFVAKMLYHFAPDVYRRAWGTNNQMPDTWSLWNAFTTVWDSSTAADRETPPALQPGDIVLFSSGWYAGMPFPRTYTDVTKRHVFLYLGDGRLWDMVPDYGPANDHYGYDQTPATIWAVGGYVSATRWCVVRPNYGGE